MNSFNIVCPELNGSGICLETLVTVQILGDFISNPVLLKMTPLQKSSLQLALGDILTPGYLNRLIAKEIPLLQGEIRIIHLSYFIKQKIKGWLVNANLIKRDTRLSDAFISLINYSSMEIQNSQNKQHIALTIMTSESIQNTEKISKTIGVSETTSQSNDKNTADHNKPLPEQDIMTIKVEPSF